MCCTMHASEDSRRDLNAIEKQIETARKETRRSLTRVVRDASRSQPRRRSGRPWRVRRRGGRRSFPGACRGVYNRGDAPRL
jgi:hypothetical protein